jgi:hypothetical protein
MQVTLQDEQGQNAMMEESKLWLNLLVTHIGFDIKQVLTRTFGNITRCLLGKVYWVSWRNFDGRCFTVRFGWLFICHLFPAEILKQKKNV